MRQRFALALFFLLAAGFLKISPAFSEAQPSSGSSSEIVESQAKKKTEGDIRKTKPLPPPEIIKASEAAQPEPRFYIRKIRIIGHPRVPFSEFRPIVKRYQGRDVTYSDLKEACGLIEDLLRARGYRGICFIPPQKVERGEIRLKVVIRRMGQLRTASDPPFYLRKIRLKGNIHVPFPELKAVLKRYEGRNVTYGDLKEACGLIEDLLRTHEHRGICFIPPQRVENGEVTLKVVVARMGELRIKSEIIKPPPLPAPRFYIRKVRVIGNPSVPFSDLRPILKRYEGRNVTYGDLKEACGLIEDLLRKRGYLGICFVPPQKVEKGEIRLKVVLARMGELHVEGMRYAKEEKIRSQWGIKKSQILRYEGLQAQLLKLNSSPDRVVRAVLGPGEAPGTTDVHLKVEDHLPLHFSASMDNQATKLFDRNRAVFSLRHNNLLGREDVFLVGTAFGKDFGSVFSQYLVPVNASGTKLLLDASAAQVNPKKQFTALNINGTSRTLGVSVLQNIARTDLMTSDLSVGFHDKQKKTRTLGTVNVRDHLHVFSLGGDTQWLDKFGRWKLGQNIHYGEAVRSRRELLSRQADPAFFKYDYSVQRIQQLPFKTKAVVDLQGQWTLDKLTPEEQVFLGGATTVRGYPESDYGADNAFVANLEYWVPLSVRPKNETHLLAFYDYGWGRLNGPTSSDKPSRVLQGVGVGLNIKILNKISGRVEWGFAVGQKPLTESGKSQIHFSVQSDF